MSKPGSDQTEGRKGNAAQPPGAKPGLVSDRGVKRTGRKSQTAAGPDGPDAGAIGETFKGNGKSG